MLHQETVGQRVRRLRIEKYMSQEELADNAGMSLSSLAGIESGAIRLFGPYLEPLANQLSVSAEYLSSGYDGPLDEIAEFAADKFRGNPALISAFVGFAREASFRTKNLNRNELEFLVEQFLNRPT